jgi:tetratricopeptide (TPR) repeat protein
MVAMRILSFRAVATLVIATAWAVPVAAQLAAPSASRAVRPEGADPEAAAKLTPEQRGDVFMARKLYRDAIEAYQTGDKGDKKADPRTSAVLANKIGIAYHQLGDFAAARRNYERAMKLDKHYADAVNNSGTVFYAQKNFRAAITRYRRAIQLAPETASFWSNLGTAWYSRGKFEEMAQAYQKALSLDPNIFEHRGMVGTELQDRTVADRARYHYELARMYAQNGKDELALQYLRKSLEEGWKDKKKIMDSPEFAALRETDAFKELMTLEPRVL